MVMKSGRIEQQQTSQIDLGGLVMRFSSRFICLFLLACTLTFTMPLAAQESDGHAKRDLPADLPAWAYGYDSIVEGPRADTPDSEARGGKDDGALRHVPDSTRSF